MKDYNPKKRWCVYVFISELGIGDEWYFKYFHCALRFAKRKLKDGCGVTITHEEPQRFSNKGDRR